MSQRFHPEPTVAREKRSRRVGRGAGAAWLTAVLLAAVGCGGGPIHAPPDYRPVVRSEIARLEATPAPSGAALTLEAEAEARELLGFLAGAEGGLRGTAVRDFVALGDGTVPLLGTVLASDTGSAALRELAIELLGAVGSERAATQLLAAVERSGEARVREACARELGRGTHDHVLPGLLRRQLRETDPAVSAQLAEAVARLTEAPSGSARYQLEVWRLIDAGTPAATEDASYVLPRLGAGAAVCLARALGDQRADVRLRAAQALERMGPSGSAAGSALVDALDDAELAPAAAAALGRVGFPPAERALIACTSPRRSLALRVAAARALGFLGLPSSVDALLALLDDDEPAELRQAAAESIAYAGAGERTAAVLLACMESDRLDPTTSEAALGYWLAQRARQRVARADEVLADWNAAADPPGVARSPETSRERCRVRARAVRVALPALLR